MSHRKRFYEGDLHPGSPSHKKPRSSNGNVDDDSKGFYELIPLFTSVPTFKDLDRGSKEILDFYKSKLPSDSEYQSKFEMWSKLTTLFRSNSKDPEAQLMIFGSTLSGLSRKGSDMDICIMSTHFSEKFTLLKALRGWIRGDRSLQTSHMEMVPAKVPILKAVLALNGGQPLEIDFSCNDPTGVRNSHLIFSYGKLDSRFKPLYFVLKAWASLWDIADAKDFGISSFSLILMLIHYLQAGASPPVLPVLHDIGPSHFREALLKEDIMKLPYKPEADVSFTSSNTQSLRGLLKGFFIYYSVKFDFSKDVGSVRTGKALDAQECYSWSMQTKAMPRQWLANVLMEEPFNRSNTARSTINRPKFESILSALQTGHRILVIKNGPLSDLLYS